jgi:hypothetical protein
MFAVRCLTRMYEHNGPTLGSCKITNLEQEARDLWNREHVSVRTGDSLVTDRTIIEAAPQPALSRPS